MTIKAAPSNKPIFHIKVELDGIDPPIWRRLLVVPTIKPGNLHDIIQLAMGWTDRHLHRFEVDGVDYMQHYDEPFERG
jgi:hypothetical protein